MNGKLDLVIITLQGALRPDYHRCRVCIGHSLLCEMTLISLLPNLAESISPAIREEEGREEKREKGKRWSKVRQGRKEETREGRKERKVERGCSCLSSAYHSLHNMFLSVTEPVRPSSTRTHTNT